MCQRARRDGLGGAPLAPATLTCGRTCTYTIAGAAYVMLFVQEYAGDAQGDHSLLSVRERAVAELLAPVLGTVREIVRTSRATLVPAHSPAGEAHSARAVRVRRRRRVDSQSRDAEVRRQQCRRARGRHAAASGAAGADVTHGGAHVHTPGEVNPPASHRHAAHTRKRMAAHGDIDQHAVLYSTRRHAHVHTTTLLVTHALSIIHRR